MIRKLIIVLSIFSILVALTLGGFYFYWAKIVMKSPAYPFFSNVKEAINEAKWPLSRVRPYYITSYASKGSNFLLVAYKDKGSRTHFIRVFVGGGYKGERVSFTPIMVGGEWIWPTALEDYRRILQREQQFEIGFLYSAYKPQNTSIEVCSLSPQPCEVATLVAGDKQIYDNFIEKQSLPLGKVLPALFINMSIDGAL